MSRSKKEIIQANIAYNKEHTTQFKMSLNNRTDQDIITHLSTVPNKQGYIKSLIRKDIEKTSGQC